MTPKGVVMRMMSGDSFRSHTLARVLPLFLILFFWTKLYAQAPARGEGRIENARWSIVGNAVVITYDLVADPSLEYEVGVVLRKEGEPGYKLVPRTVTGAIGKGKFAGLKKEIRWDYKKDVPAGIYGDDYVFEFAIYPIRDTGGSKLWLYLLSGAAVVGGAAAILIKPSPGTAEGGPTGLPDAPRIRPQN